MIRPSRRTVGLAIVAVVVLGALGAGGWLWYAAAQREAMAAHAAALAGAAAAQTAEARTPAIRRLEAALATYPSAPAAAETAYQLGNLRYDAGQYAEARAAYEIAVAQRPTPTIQALASAGIGEAWEAERNYPKAVEAYQATLERVGPRGFLYETLLVSLGRVQELAGRRDEAIGTYRRVLKDVPDSRRADQIRARLARLGVIP